MQKQIMAHRGACRLEHENTLKAFQKAIDLGADIIELDVRQTKDGLMAVFHDEAIAGKKISQLSFNELNSITKEKNFEVPALGEALALIKGRTKVQIEIKATGYEKEVVNAALEILNPADFSIISFDFAILQKVRDRFPNISLGQILSPDLKYLRQFIKFLFNRNEVIKTVNFFSLDKRLLLWHVAAIVPADNPITIWNADEPKVLNKFLSHSRVSVIGTNKPDLAIKLKQQFYE